MNKKLLTAAALTLLLSGQTAMANNNAEEFLSWLDGQDTVQVTESNQFDTVSLQNESDVDNGYQAENDIFSIHYMSNN